MIFLFLSIICATILFLIFKLFEKNKVDNAQAIVINYMVAALIGFLLIPSGKISQNNMEQSWLIFAAIIGALFLFLFQLVAITSQKIGISTATVANKMGVVIPVTAAFFLYGDDVSFIKITGIVLAITGVYLASKREKSQQNSFQNHSDRREKNYLFLFPVILFLGSGISDTLIKYTQHFHLNNENMLLFIPSLFGFSALTGMIDAILRRNISLTKKNILWGIILGIPNYGSIFFLLKALEEKQSSVIFSLNNMGIVALSSVAAFFIFNEKLSKHNWLGILISIIAIFLISFAE